ncbi:MAG: hypothetical protein AAGI51_03785 [Pseudomonadota bacterium]
MKLRESVLFATTAMSMTLLCSGAQAVTLPGASEIEKYLIVGMRRSGIGEAVNIQNTEIGADRQVLSDGSSVENSQGEAPPNTKDVFYQDGDRWKSTSNPDSAIAADIFEGIDNSGNVAITSENGDFSMSNVDVFADPTIGIQCASGSDCGDSVENSNFYGSDPGVPTNGNRDGRVQNGDGVTGFDSTALLTELEDWKSFVENLAPEFTITGNIENENRKDASGPEILDLTSKDLNNDGIAVIDIDRGDNDFELNNSDWILTGNGFTRAIFRILNGSNFNISNSSILMGTDYGPVEDIFAIFVHSSEERDSSDAVFNANNTVLNGIGLWDLNTVGDRGNTELVVNNGQGCAQFISSSVNFNDVRFNRCSTGLPTTTVIPLPAGLPLVATAFGLAWIVRRRAVS